MACMPVLCGTLVEALRNFTLLWKKEVAHNVEGVGTVKQWRKEPRKFHLMSIALFSLTLGHVCNGPEQVWPHMGHRKSSITLHRNWIH